MHYHIKIALILFISICFIGYAEAQLESETPTADYIFETIEVPGVDFLEVTASNDRGHYAGNTRSPDDSKFIGFTLIDGVFTTYDAPNSERTVFYGLNNAGQAAGFYVDQDGIYHGIILQDGEPTVFDFPGAVDTQPYGIGEAGQLIGNIVDADGVSHGFVGNTQIDVPGAARTYADHINAAGVVVGSYIDAEGMPHGFLRHLDGSFTTIDVPQIFSDEILFVNPTNFTRGFEEEAVTTVAVPEIPDLEFLFVNAISDSGVAVFRAQAVDDIPRTYVRPPDSAPVELRVPGSVSTVARDIDAQNQIVGFYDTPDGHRHGFIARPTMLPDGEDFSNIFFTSLSKGLNMLSVPLKSPAPMTARSLAVTTGATAVIKLDTTHQAFVAWTPNAPDNGFPIEGAKGYIVNLPEARNITFVGTKWTNETEAAAAPTLSSRQTWAFVVSGHLEGVQHFNGYIVQVRNLRTNTVMTSHIRGNYFAAATADLTYRSVVEAGDTLELIVVDTNGNIVSEKFSFTVNAANLENAVMSVTLDGIGTPKRSRLLQNYPNPFNPETWIPYHLAEAGTVSLSIYDAAGNLIRTLPLGYQLAGFYQNREHAAHWDGRNALGEPVASGVYFYQLTTPSFQQTRRMLILK